MRRHPLRQTRTQLTAALRGDGARLLLSDELSDDCGVNRPSFPLKRLHVKKENLLMPCNRASTASFRWICKRW